MYTLQDLKPFVLPVLLLTLGVSGQFAQTHCLILAHLTCTFLDNVDHFFDHPVEVVQYPRFLFTNNIQESGTVEHTTEPCPTLRDVTVLFHTLLDVCLQLLHGVHRVTLLHLAHLLLVFCVEWLEQVVDGLVVFLEVQRHVMLDKLVEVCWSCSSAHDAWYTVQDIPVITIYHLIKDSVGQWVTYE